MASPIHGAAGMIGRKRTCPRCGHRQTVPVIVTKHSVTCRRCGAQIPPQPRPDTAAVKNPRRT